MVTENKKELKQSIAVFRNNSSEAFILGLYLYKYKKWTTYQIKNNRVPTSLNMAVSLANRILNRIPINKSSNIDSQQQALINTWKYMNKINFKSKRNLVDEQIIRQYITLAKNYKEAF